MTVPPTRKPGTNYADYRYQLRRNGTNTPKDEDAASPTEKLADAERIRQLERENKRLREERDILRKAAKYFAEETTW